MAVLKNKNYTASLGIKLITGGSMTKLEFAAKLEKYEKKHRRSKWEYFGFTSSKFAVLGGLCLAKAWNIKIGTEEHELLINALDLLSANDT